MIIAKANPSPCRCTPCLCLDHLIILLPQKPSFGAALCVHGFGHIRLHFAARCAPARRMCHIPSLIPRHLLYPRDVVLCDVSRAWLNSGCMLAWWALLHNSELSCSQFLFVSCWGCYRGPHRHRIHKNAMFVWKPFLATYSKDKN